MNANKGKKERIGRLLQMHANSREDVKIARAGDIVAVAGLKDVITGETLCDEKAPIVLERMEFPGMQVGFGERGPHVCMCVCAFARASVLACVGERESGVWAKCCVMKRRP